MSRPLLAILNASLKPIWWYNPTTSSPQILWDKILELKDRTVGLLFSQPPHLLDALPQELQAQLPAPLRYFVDTRSHVTEVAIGPSPTVEIPSETLEALRYLKRTQVRLPRLPRPSLPVPYDVRVVADSYSSDRHRLTTWLLTYPRFVHAELMTHRIFSRNSASSRAIPSEKMRKMIQDAPALPLWWGKNQSGMQAREELGDARQSALTMWLEARDNMLSYSQQLADLGLHKQLCNRVTEPWMPITVLVSATDFGNFFYQRDHKDAQPEIAAIATEMHYQYRESRPKYVDFGAWHLPFISETDYTEILARVDELAPEKKHEDETRSDRVVRVLKAVSMGRCARLSYLTHEGKRDLLEDVSLHDKLVATCTSEDPGHFSPAEHVATPSSIRRGNFQGWLQYRAELANESGPSHECYDPCIANE